MKSASLDVLPVGSGSGSRFPKLRDDDDDVVMMQHSAYGSTF